MPEPDAAATVAAYARGCLTAARWDRDWFRAAVAMLEAAGERIVQTEQPAKDGGPWTVLDWRTGSTLATITGGQDHYDATWPEDWTDVAWIGAWVEDLTDNGRPAADWPAILPPPPPISDPPTPLDLPLPRSLAGRLEETIEDWALQAGVIPDRATEVAELTGWPEDQVLACTASWLTVPGERYMRLGDTDLCSEDFAETT
jgi:hypothetical protein